MPEKKLKPLSRIGIFPKLISEGYCCPYGYLKLCRARGETKASMAKWLGVPFYTMKNAFRALKRGEHVCLGYSGCMKPLIEEIEREKSSLKTPSDRPPPSDPDSGK